MLHFPPDLDEASFLENFWQRKPLLLRQALPGIRSLPSPEELAGLACEPDVESRIVVERGGTYPWEVRHGPFSEAVFSSLPQTRWTLLVQDVDKLIPEVATLLAEFRFLPDWRLDDVMISYAVDKGSVGPHLDEYDVFLLQARGRRRWRIDPEPGSDLACIPDLDLRILERFEPREEYLLEPGDLLYLPPGIPHWGIADGPCMTWSVGFRAATWQEMGTAWGDFAAARALPAGRFRDLHPGTREHTGEIPPEVFQQIRRTLDEGLRGAADRLFREWLGRFVTEPKEHLQVFPADTPLSPADLLVELRNGRRLERNGFSRTAFCRGEADQDLLFANGEAYELPCAQGDFLPILTRGRVMRYATIAPWLEEPECLALLCRLYNDGHYELRS